MSGPKTADPVLTAIQRKLLEEERKKRREKEKRQRIEREINRLKEKKNSLCENILVSLDNLQPELTELKELCFESGSEAGNNIASRLASQRAIVGSAAAENQYKTVDEINGVIKKLKKLEKEISASGEAIRQAVDKTREGLFDKKSDEFSGGMAALAVDEAEKEEKHCKEWHDIKTVFEDLAEAELSQELSEEFDSLCNTFAKSCDRQFLRGFFSLNVKPFKNKCDEYMKLKPEYDSLMADYSVLCSEAKKQSEYFECSADGITRLRKAKDELEQLLAQKEEQNYIDRAISDVFEEMGYTRIGIMKSAGEQLYQLEGGTAVDVVVSEDGAVTMQLGGLDTVDRQPTSQERVLQKKSMESFCEDYETVCKKLLEKGVKFDNPRKLPPSEACAQIININDFEETGKAVLKKEGIVRQTAKTNKARRIE